MGTFETATDQRPNLGSNKAVGLTPMVRKDPRVCPFRKGFPRTNPVTRGWDVSMINPTLWKGLVS